jgi:hypothetical protein
LLFIHGKGKRQKIVGDASVGFLLVVRTDAEFVCGQGGLQIQLDALLRATLGVVSNSLLDENKYLATAIVWSAELSKNRKSRKRTKRKGKRNE